MTHNETLTKKIHCLTTTLWQKVARHGASLSLDCLKTYFKIGYLINRAWPKTIDTITLKDGNKFNFYNFYYHENWLNQINILHEILAQLGKHMADGNLIDTHKHGRYERHLLVLINALEKEFKHILTLKPRGNGRISCETFTQNKHLFDAFKQDAFSDVIIDLETQYRTKSPLTIHSVIPGDMIQLKGKPKGRKKQDDKAA
jgi:hypothetical protein